MCVCSHLLGIILAFSLFYFFICNIRCFYLFFFFFSHLCLVLWNLHTPLVLYWYWSLELNQDDIYFLGGLWKHEKNIYIYIRSRGESGRETLNVLICDSQGSCRRPLENLLSLCLFLYFSSLLFPPSLPMLRSDFRSQFHSQPYFLSVQLILYPTIHSFYSPDIYLFFLFAFPSISVYISVFPHHPECDHIVHFSVMYSTRCGSGIRDLLLQDTSPKEGRFSFIVAHFNPVHSRSKVKLRWSGVFTS